MSNKEIDEFEEKFLKVVNTIETILRVLSVVLIALMCPILMVWIMGHQPFEEVVRACFAIATFLVSLLGLYKLF